MRLKVGLPQLEILGYKARREGWLPNNRSAPMTMAESVNPLAEEMRTHRCNRYAFEHTGDVEKQ